MRGQPTEVATLVGARFGRWSVLAVAASGPRGGRRVQCRCDCGREQPVVATDLLRGHSHGCRRCGVKRHGQAGLGRVTPEYRAWADLRARCLNADHASYPDYGGRGIAVCARWLASFENFLADMGPRPSSRYSLDRKDNDGPYSTENCRWATRAEQNRNHRRNTVVSIGERTQCLEDWIAAGAVPRMTVYGRLRRGWSHERALTTPSRPGGFVRRGGSRQ